MRFEYWKWDAGAIDESVCDSWVKKYSPVAQFAQVGEHDTDISVRRSSVYFVSEDETKEIMAGFIRAANREAFGFDVTDFTECQFTEYVGDIGGFYGWHYDSYLHDNPHAFDRKLSCVAMLSDPSDFDGGEFMFQFSNEPIKLEKGSVIVFPSFLVHQVTPVTRGKRHTMVSWMEGAAWR